MKERICPSTDEWIRKMWSIYTMEYYASIRKDEYPTFVAAWTGLEEIMLNEERQRESIIIWFHLFVQHNKYHGGQGVLERRRELGGIGRGGES